MSTPNQNGTGRTASKEKINGKARRSRKVLVVGIRIPSWASFTRSIFSGVMDYMRHHGQWQIQTLVDSTNEMAPTVIDKDWQGDGLILFRFSDQEATAFKRRKIPVVNISTECAGRGFPTVIPDNREIGCMAAEHLLSLGLKHFSYWGDPSRAYSQARGKAFAERLRESGFDCLFVDFKPDNFPWKRRWKMVHNHLLKSLPKLSRPMGIFAKDDILGTNIIRVCNELDIFVPHEVAVVGTNADEVFCQISSPPLTSVAYPGEQVGCEAATLLNQMMTCKSVPDTLLRVVPISRIDTRESTSTLAVDDTIVAQAVERIRRQAPDYPLRVGELVEKVSMSHSGFKRHFMREMGLTPKAEINRVRLMHLQTLLKTTKWPINQIARQMHFESSEELARFFRRQTGLTATNYRRGYQP